MLKPVHKWLTTEKYEAACQQLIDDFNEFSTVATSSELQEFIALRDFVESDKFKQRKKEIKQQKFEGTEQHRQLQEYKKLSKHRGLKRYFKLKESEQLKRYQQIEKSGLIAEFETLQKEVHSGGLSHRATGLKRREYKISEQYKKLQHYKELKKNSDLKFFYRFGKSSAFHNHEKMAVSGIPEKFLQLKETVHSDEFREFKAHMEDKKKFEKSEEYHQLLKYQEMSECTHLINYFRYEKSDAFDALKRYSESFTDHFEAKALNTKKWSVKNYPTADLLKAPYSLMGELQGYTGGKNILLADSDLHLHVHKDPVSGLQWRPGIGFIETEFNYSSDLINNGHAFTQQYGVFEVKANIKPTRGITHAIYLSGGKSMPHIDLVKSVEKSLFAGVYSEKATHKQKITSRYAGKYAVYRLDWSPGKLIWSINGRQVFEATFETNEKLFLNITSIVTKKISASSPAPMKIDWVRCYQD